MCTLDAVYSWVKMTRGYVMRNYIDQITNQRKLAEKEIFETQTQLNEECKDAEETQRLQTNQACAKARKGLFKLMNNSLSGKTYQSDEKYGESVLVNNHKQYNAATNGKLVLDRTIISSDLVEVQMRKKQALIKSPRYLASSLLWLSKIKMLDFYYNQLMRVSRIKDLTPTWKVEAHPNNIKLYGTDTDSIKFQASSLHGETMREKYNDFLQAFKDATIMDSDGTAYTLYALGFQKDGEIIPGKMKLEELFTEGIYLKPKLYAQYNAEDDGEFEMHAKGVQLYQNPKITIETYRKVLREESVEFATHTNIQKTKKLGSVENVTLTQTKVAMDSFDDKRRWFDCNRSEPYGMFSRGVRAIDERIERNICDRIQRFVDIDDDKIMEYLGCTIKELKKQFEKGWIVTGVNCCWKNYGKRWHIDHFAPAVLLRTDKSERMLKKICHCNNLQPLSASANASKGATITPEAQAYLDK